MKDIFKLVMFFFIGAIIVLVVTHSAGFSQAAGTLFTGVNKLGTTLTGAGPVQGGGYGTTVSTSVGSIYG